ncbi:hypothetical protein [Halococcus sp. AFM35]|uniref:hypothetical protein n=1 Tax=Halococcus sp. AFM35 TaxID=3421653 RepID=UPI003EB69A70
MGTLIAGVYVPDDGETGWALGENKVNDSLELLATRTQNLSADGTALDGDAASVGGNAPSDILLDTFGSVDPNNLSFDPVTDEEQTTHTNDTDAHHEPTPNTQAFALAAEGTTSLNGSEVVVVDTGVAVDAGYYMPVPGELPDNMDIVLSLEKDTGGTGTFQIHIEQNTTAVTTGTVGWQLMESTLGGSA